MIYTVYDLQCKAMEDRRQVILDAAMALADERGLDAVSMRAVAGRVGVTPMALYPHVGSKAELLDAMMGRLIGELLPPSTGPAEVPASAGQRAEPLPGQLAERWQDRFDQFAHAARNLARRHPWIASLLFSRPAVAPDALRAVDLIYQVLLDAGVPESQVPRLERLVSTFFLGFAASEAGGRFGAGPLDPRGRREQLPEGALPAFSRLVPWLGMHCRLDAEFDADLADLRQMIEAIAEHRDG